jgi:septal ring factor EnvC (AmiA/AmiB activator)
MKYFILIAAAALTLSSCNQAELDRQKHMNDSLQAMVNERDSSVGSFLSAFNDIERNLDSVAARQNIINASTAKGGELQPNQKDRINAEIAAINDLMVKNQKKIAELNRKLKASGNKNALLEKTIETLKAQLAEKDAELAALNEKLNKLNAEVAQLHVTVDTLTAQNKVTTQALNETTTALHAAYYVIGKSKQLKESNIIDRKGGLLGIGKTSQLSQNFDNSKFTRIDYTQTTTIPVNGTCKIITTHPADSYTLEKESKNIVKHIVISNPEKFWSASKYLVIVQD